MSSEVDQTEIWPSLEIFRPAGVGNSKLAEKFSLEIAATIIPRLARFAEGTGKIVSVSSALENLEEVRDESTDEAVDLLGNLFESYGSDKATHGYHRLYGSLFPERSDPKVVIEIGLGSNFTDVPSNMGSQGVPGASLRALRDFFTDALIVGADIDPRVLFSEERIITHLVDQTDLSSLSGLQDTIPPTGADLIIDDGFHALHANLNTLDFGLRVLRIGGFLSIEDIPDSAQSFWELVSHLVPSGFSAKLFRANDCLVFLVQRVS